LVSAPGSPSYPAAFLNFAAHFSGPHELLFEAVREVCSSKASNANMYLRDLSFVPGSSHLSTLRLSAADGQDDTAYVVDGSGELAFSLPVARGDHVLFLEEGDALFRGSCARRQVHTSLENPTRTRTIKALCPSQFSFVSADVLVVEEPNGLHAHFSLHGTRIGSHFRLESSIAPQG
jgi:hypothetical protein